MPEKNDTPTSLTKRRKQYRESKRKQRAKEKKGLEFSIKLSESELNTINHIRQHSELITKSSIIKELIKEAGRRKIKYNIPYEQVELIIGDPDHIHRLYEAYIKKQLLESLTQENLFTGCFL